MNTTWFKYGLACLLLSGNLHAQDKPATRNSTEPEALELLNLALDYVKKNGVDKAIVEFNRTEGPFNSVSGINKNGDLYLFGFDFNGNEPIHGKIAKIRGKNTLNLRDQNGVYMVQEMIAKCKKDGKGSVNYVWPHPQTGQLEPKTALVVRVPDAELCLATGIYRPGT